MNPLITAFTLLLTIAIALGLGVFLGYAAVSGILTAMRREPSVENEHAVAITEAAGGD